MEQKASRKKDGVAPVHVGHDWHPADIKAALDKAGWSLSQLSIYHGVSRNCMGVALRRPFPKAERIIAEVIGDRPQDIWPSRYNEDGTTNRTGKKPKRPQHLKHTNLSAR